MGDIVKLALRLFIFALVASVLLAVTNEVTKGPIEQQKLASKMAALNTVLPGCEYEQIEYEGISDDSALDEIFIGKNADGSIKGYALTANPQGYGGEIPITLGVSEGGYVTQVYVGSLQETQGLGSRVGDDAFKEQFIAIAADPDTLRNDVDTIAGATISSSAFVNAVQEMLTYTKGTLGIEPHAGDKDAILAEAAAINGGDEGEDAPVETTTNTYDVTGFAPFKVDVTVDSNGKIVSVTVPENNETPGFGADLIADQSVFDALVGQDIATAQIDVKSGVTLTSNAINDALKQAASAGESGEGSAKAYDVTGFAPFKVEIALDDAGKIVSVSVPENNETPGFGADMLTDEALVKQKGRTGGKGRLQQRAPDRPGERAQEGGAEGAVAENGGVIRKPDEFRRSAHRVCVGQADPDAVGERQDDGQRQPDHQRRHEQAAERRADRRLGKACGGMRLSRIPVIGGYNDRRHWPTAAFICS